MWKAPGYSGLWIFSQRGADPGVISSARVQIDRTFGGGRPEDAIEETTEDPFWTRDLQIDEDMRTGKSRTLSVEETRREMERIKRGTT